MSEPTSEDVLNTPIPDDVSGPDAPDIRGYLIDLLHLLWEHDSNFNSKRPFGYSGWHYDLYQALVKAGYIEATLDEDGFIHEFAHTEQAKADKMIKNAIQWLGREV
jgi:hypothetical protein